MDGTAVIFTQRYYQSPQAKTAHGLVRGTERYQILAVLDSEAAGQDAGTVLDGRPRQIPIVSGLEAFLATGQRADYLIIGIANAGGKLDPAWMPVIADAIRAGMSIVSGMHELLADQPVLTALAEAQGVRLIDVRRPRHRDELHFWTGEIHEVTSARIAVLGTDCAVGKRTAARMLTQACRQDGLQAEMIYTGQTGWMQGGQYGFVFDATLNDFVSGELEHAIVSCYRNLHPDVMFIEGQAALRNPSGPCGSEMLVSGNANGVILVHPPGRVYYKGWEHLGRKIFPLYSEVQLVEAYGPRVLGIALNTQHLSHEEALTWQRHYEKELSIPVVLPVEEGVNSLIPAVRSLIH
ncbi:MAG: DUF1611 domain-containing protein [Bacteroidia bacterium]|nr:DUF1611 domain-containing protein [Bacteroidia bacterium]